MAGDQLDLSIHGADGQFFEIGLDPVNTASSRMEFGGEGLFPANRHGRGNGWLQSPSRVSPTPSPPSEAGRGRMRGR